MKVLESLLKILESARQFYRAEFYPKTARDNVRKTQIDYKESTQPINFIQTCQEIDRLTADVDADMDLEFMI